MEKSEFVESIKSRTKKLALDVIFVFDSSKKTDSSIVIGKQLIRSITSVAANYRAACISRSQKEFFAKISILVEEADEALFWLEMLRDANFISKEKVQPLMDETLEILKIVSKARKNVNFN
ncbi:MAG: four helix bundle protein [Polaribacter sp.]|nr:four helix bundle protein [Polaribacter sp.]